MSLRHVLCVYPYRKDPGEWGHLPPIGLELIAAAIEPKCASLEVLDLRKNPGRTAAFCRAETDMVCFSVNWKVDTDFILEEIRSVPAGIMVLVGGRHATENPEEWLNSCPNVFGVVRGDGEEAIEEICNGLPSDGIKSLSFRRNGELVHNPNRIPGDLSNTLVPVRHLRKRSYQIGVRGVDTGLLVDLVSSSRGCPFNCQFCSFSRNPWGTKRPWSARSPESVVDELAQIEAPLVLFTDDLFTFEMDRVERICDLILARGLKKKYLINARLDIAKRPDVLRKMEKAGFLMLMLGIESTSDKTLKAMSKGFDTNTIRERCKVLGKSSMILHGYFIIGCIGETAEDMRRVPAFAKELRLNTIALSALRTSPYSGIEELVAQTEGYHIAPDGKVYSDHCSAADLRDLRHEIYRRFFTPGQLTRLVAKGINNGLLMFLPRVLMSMPRVILTLARAERAKKRKNAAQRKSSTKTT